MADLHLQPYNIIRLGRVGDKARPIKLVGLPMHTRENLLKSAARIRGIEASLGFNSVFIKPDLTPKQQLSNRLLRTQLKTRRENGENVVIRNGQIVMNNNTSRPIKKSE